MSDLSKVKIGSTTYNLKDAEARVSIATLTASLDAEIERAQTAEATLTTNLAAEVTRATDVESGLNTRITNLEARGRFLSSWNCVTGKPADYPTTPSSATSYVYEYRVGDYYLVSNVAGTGESNLQPSGGFIKAVKSGDTWTWTVPTAAESREVGNGDYYICSTVSGEGEERTATWVWVQNSQKTVNFSQIQGEPTSNEKLASALNAKLNATATVAGVAFTTGATPNIPVGDLQTALGLGSLAYKNSATGSTVYVPGGTLNKIDVTAAGTITVADFTQTSTAASLTTADYTPAGSITGEAIKGGSITVTIKDTSAEATLTTAAFTPTGSVTGATISALTTATFQADNDGIQIGGTISAPTITVNDSAKDTFIKTLTDGTVDAASIDTSKFDGGSFTGATAATFTQGAKASFTQGTKASFDKGTAVSAAIEGLVATVGEEGTADAETLIFTAAATDNVIGHDEATFTPNGNDTFTPNGNDTFTANEVGTFTGATINTGFFSAHKLPVAGTTATAVISVSATAAAPEFTGYKYKVSTASGTALSNATFTATNSADIVNKVEYLKQGIDTAIFTPEAATLGFSGSKVENALVTGVSYDRATSAGATFNPTTKEVTPEFNGASATITITVQ